MVLITLFSLFSFPGNGIAGFITIPHSDKIVHFGFHFIIVILGTLFVKERSVLSFTVNRVIFNLFLFSFIYGVVIELLQYIMPYGRAAEIWDVLANLSGAVFGGLLIKKYLSRIRE